MLKGSLPEIFLDTDVCFDIISKRDPHFKYSIKLLELAADDRISLMISESCLANLIYLTFDIYKIKNAS
jgi:predicted nucleic acid-binding protein